MMAKRIIGKVDGKEIYEVVIKNKEGYSFSAMTYGATITKLIALDRNGNKVDVAVGFETVDDYVKLSDNQGAAIGRCCNRIGGAKFTLDGVEYKLETKNPPDILHGNDEFRQAVWDIKELKGDSVTFSYTSKDGSMGFPGNLQTNVRYALEGGKLRIQWQSVCDKKTIINLTNHLYFNLSGDSERTVYDHSLFIDADKYTPADENLIITGEIASVEGTALDFRKEKLIGQDIASDDPTVSVYGGYDLNWCLNNYDGKLRHVSTLALEENGIEMKVYTDMPGMQVYSGNVLDSFKGKGDKCFCHHGAVCLETQFYPDAINHPNFYPCTYDAGEVFASETVYEFTTR